MFELGIFCVLVLVVGYWAAVWIMGRRGDVLHGKFVEADPGLELLGIGPLLPPRANRDSLQALLAAINQDLEDAGQM